MVNARTQRWIVDSSPAPGDPLVPKVERLANRLRSAVAQLQERIEIPFGSLYEPFRSSLGFVMPSYDLAARSAWAVIGEWLVGVSTGNLSIRDGLSTGHEWFWQGREDIGYVPDSILSIDNVEQSDLFALMPYLLDPNSPATRRDVLRSRAGIKERSARKALGVYYTPGDVASLMVRRVHESGDYQESDVWLDPACGSGVFLRAILMTIFEEEGASHRIYGVDIDPYAVEAAAFVLTAADLATRATSDMPWRLWHRFRSNLATADSLKLKLQVQRGVAFDALTDDCNEVVVGGTWRLGDAFPELKTTAPRRIVANPPYAPPTPSQKAIAKCHWPITGASLSRDVSPAFVELCESLLDECGSMAMVTPLSEVASSQEPFPRLREFLGNRIGSVEFRSYDRAPDALFGDDIKTRNAIIIRDCSETDGVFTTSLLKWTSSSRSSFLASSEVIEVSRLGFVPTVLPKIGQVWERDLLQACLSSSVKLEALVPQVSIRALAAPPRSPSGSPVVSVAVAPTAYNFLGVLRNPLRAVVDGHTSTNPQFLLEFDSDQMAAAVYALLSSRVALWLWRVFGDGFHVSKALLQWIPAPGAGARVIDDLAVLGDELWKRVVEVPLVSRNAGRMSISYPPHYLDPTLDEIDGEIGEIIGSSEVLRLKEWHQGLVLVDSQSRDRRFPQRSRK